MAMECRVKRPKAANLPNTKADIVFCVDSTSSMQPCFDALIANLDTFIESLQSEANVDVRLRLIGFRDLHDPTCRYDWTICDFTGSIAEFRSQLSSLEAKCGQEFRGAESSMDALFYAVHSNWRESKTLRVVVMITDDDTYKTLHPSLYDLPDNGVERVIQDIQELRHSMVFLVCPKFPVYQKIADSMATPDQKIGAIWIANKGDETYKELANLNWSSLLRMLGQAISKTSIIVGT